ncbi:MAG TPA: MMPL family transporter, partial [Polyangiaceae bacterium LLY-WYZ-15_(1-7)]|nr:MMPL family transporter [Polyangiaceae bacterium LLY-WYZ-15_(1-7)]
MGTALLRHRRALLALFALAAVVAALGLPRLEQDLDPRALVPGARSQPARVAFLFRAAPGEALADARLAASHRVARALASRPGVQRVDAPTTTPIPHVPVARGLAALEEDAEGDDAPGLDTLAALVEAAPERLPGGLSALGERLGGALVVAPLVRGPAPSPDELARAREVLEAPALRGGPVGRSGASLLVVATLAPDADAAAVVRVAEEVAGDVRVEATGAPLLEAALKAQLARDPELVAGLAALGNFLVLFLGFRRQAGVALPMLAAGASVLLVLGTLGWLGHPITLLSIIVPPLLLTVAVGDAVHLVGRYAEERALGRDADAAAARTHEAMARACFATSLTTALGLASLAWAELPALRDFALVGAAGVLVAYLVTVGLLPLLLPVAGRAPRPARGELGLAGWALAHPWRALGASALVLVAALVAALGVRAETRLLEPFPADEPLVERADFLAREHGGLRRLTLTLPVDPATPAGLAEVRALRAELASEPGVARVAGPDALLDAAWATLAEGPLPEDRATLQALAGLVAALPTWRDATAEGATLEVGLADVPAERLVALGERLG